MGLTKERKIFLGLAAVAGVALIADQGIFSTQGASAQSVAIEQMPLAEPIVELSPQEPSLPAAKVLIDRVNNPTDLGSNSSMGSIFSLTKMIKPKANDPAGDDSGGNLIDELLPEESFGFIESQRQDLPVLSAVMPSKTGGGAVVNGEILRIGQTSDDGYRLVRVEQRSVIIEQDGVQYTLEIPRISGD